jgi:hypothetical protein
MPEMFSFEQIGSFTASFVFDSDTLLYSAWSAKPVFGST